MSVDTKETRDHAVAVIGGAAAGAEIASRLADQGCLVAVFEQNARPFGKIEDGLPRWHRALRFKEYERITERLDRPGVQFVPNTRIGRDIAFPELVQDWGFQAVVLAQGAWRDRPLPIDGIDAYVDRGLVYQNPFIYWFNHAPEASYDGPPLDVVDDALVVGGGLASVDVAKALTLETTRRELAKRDIDVDVEHLEVKGIPAVLSAHGLSWDDLGLRGCTLFYRRRIEDMPVVSMPDGADDKRRATVEAGRARLLAKAQEKFCFRVEPLCSPDAPLVEDGRLVGLRFRRTRMENGRPVATDETFERRGSCVFSSIGSIPEPIEGIEMKGELLKFIDWDLGRLERYPTVFAAGNIVTGKGNIIASRKHAQQIAEHVAAQYLGLEERTDGAIATPASEAAAPVATRIREHVEGRPAMGQEEIDQVIQRVRSRQTAVGYDGDLRAWLDSVTPPDRE